MVASLPGTLSGGEGGPLFESSLSVEEYVIDYFSDIPIMAEIARCESEFRHFNRKGNTLRGKENRYDIGVMQINEHYHLEAARKLGDDIHTLAGNLDYARHLYEKKGTQPWQASKPCWKKAELAQK